jgi:hypothetical protein
MSTTSISDELFRAACKPVEDNQAVVVRKLTFVGRIIGAVEYGVKLHSNHSELVGADSPEVDQFDHRAWLDELAALLGDEQIHLSVWADIVFPTSGGTVVGIQKEQARALMAVYLEWRIKCERPDLVNLDRYRYEHREDPRWSSLGPNRPPSGACQQHRQAPPGLLFACTDISPHLCKGEH